MMNPFKTALLGCVLACGAVNPVARAVEPVSLDIAAQPIGDALNELARQSGLQVVFYSELGAGLRAPAVRGGMMLDEAFERLLAGTGLRHRFLDNKTVMVTSAVDLEGKPAAEASEVGLLRLAQADAVSTPEPHSASSSEEESGNRLQEIVVTATRHSESLQDVPMSIVAITSEDISRRNLESATDFLRTLAGVNQIEGGAGRSSIVMRGIAINPTNEGYVGGLTTETFYGEVPLSAGRVGQTDFRLIDIDRIEVLRGPQGTQFGSNSIAGAVRYIPRAPSLTKLEGSLKAGYSHTAREGGGNDKIEGIVNIPVINDSLAVRATGYRYYNSGHVRNVAATYQPFVSNAETLGISDLLDSGRVGDTTTTGGRIALLWQPVEDVSITLTHLQQRMHQIGLSQVQTDSPNQYLDALPGDTQTQYLLTNTFGGQLGLADDSEVSNALLRFDGGWAELMSSVSYLSQTSRERTDLGVFFGDEYSGNPMSQGYQQASGTLVGELRMTSKLAGPLNFTVGIYYEDADRDRRASNRWGGTLESLETFFPTAGSEREIGWFHSVTNTRQKAAYGELSYELPHALTATFGGRYFRYDTRDSVAQDGPLFGGAVGFDTSVRDTGNVYKTNVSYKPNPDLLVYAAWSQGFRLGYAQEPLPSTCDDGNGFVEGYPGVPITASLVKPDRLDNYELGAKFGLLDSRMTLNATLFDIDWRGLPVTVFPPCEVGLVLNAGKARSRGVELESQVVLARGLRLTAGGSWTDGALAKDAEGIGSTGDALPGAPKYNFRFALDYSFGILGRPAYVQSDVSRVGPFYAMVGEQGRRLGGYTEVGLRAGLEIGAASLQVYARNLTNVRALVWTEPSAGYSNILRPATVGVDWSWLF